MCKRGNKIASLWHKYTYLVVTYLFLLEIYSILLIEQFLIQVPTKVRHTHAEGVHQNLFIIVLKSIN